MVNSPPREKKLFTIKIKQKDPNDNDGNIFKSLKLFMICSQILGILPQENIMRSPDELRFTWKSWKVLYTFILIGLSTFALTVCFLDWFNVGYILTGLATNVFYAASLMTLILYLRLARFWPSLVLLWCATDKIMNKSYGYPKSLNRKLNTIFIIYISLAIVDYILSIINRHVGMKMKFGKEYDAEKYYVEAFPQMFKFVQFNFFSASICIITQIYATLGWAINDLFIILTSISLAIRFRQIADRLRRNQRTTKNLNFWIEIREDYDRLSILCKELDKQISYIVLLSFSVNIFFLLVQLYHSLENSIGLIVKYAMYIFRTVHGFIGNLYFIFSFLYIIMKVGCVSLYAAWINDESIEPLNILNSVPSASFNIEVQRLLAQISFNNVALTGCKMFKVTRGIIFSIAGAIVTYELVLIQFNSATT